MNSLIKNQKTCIKEFIPNKIHCIKDANSNYNLNHLKRCNHGLRYFCPNCDKYISNVGDIPVPLLWITSNKGKIFIYYKFWDELINLIKFPRDYGTKKKEIAEKLDIDERGMRRWSNNNVKPKIFTNEEFSFTPLNLYFIGLLFSDGYLRNNTSPFSYSYQIGSSSPFQGYWYPQFLQRFSSIFRHKQSISNTRIRYVDNRKNVAFYTNLSGFSPIFGKFLEREKVISKKNKGISGYSKHIPPYFTQKLKTKEELFQGIWDGDGSYLLYDSPFISLSLDKSINYKCILDIFPLVPTLFIDSKRNCFNYDNLKNNELHEIRFAPTSLNRIDSVFTSSAIVDQIDFMVDSAFNSVRPDKVHSLIKIVELMISNKYGGCTNSFDIQREIKNKLKKLDIASKINLLKRRYPIKDNKFQCFIPNWAKGICSKRVWFQEMWDFFLNGENLDTKNIVKLDFSEGVDIDFKLRNHII